MKTEFSFNLSSTPPYHRPTFVFFTSRWAIFRGREQVSSTCKQFNEAVIILDLSLSYVMLDLCCLGTPVCRNIHIFSGYVCQEIHRYP